MMCGLQKSVSTPTQSYTALDYGFFCRPSGKFEVWEKTAKKYTDTQVFKSLKSDIQLRIINKKVQFIVDGQVRYESQTPILDSETVHFACAFLNHPSEVRDITLFSSNSNINYYIFYLSN